MVIETYITMINLDVNGLNASTKRLTGQKNKTHIYAVYNIPISDLGIYMD